MARDVSDGRPRPKLERCPPAVGQLRWAKFANTFASRTFLRRNHSLGLARPSGLTGCMVPLPARSRRKKVPWSRRQSSSYSMVSAKQCAILIQKHRFQVCSLHSAHRQTIFALASGNHIPILFAFSFSLCFASLHGFLNDILWPSEAISVLHTSACPPSRRIDHHLHHSSTALLFATTRCIFEYIQ